MLYGDSVMGAIVAILGPQGKVDLAAGLQRMIARAPYRGRAEVHAEDGIALGVQAWAGTLRSLSTTTG